MTRLEKNALVLTVIFFCIGLALRIVPLYGKNSDSVAVQKGVPQKIQSLVTIDSTTNGVNKETLLTIKNRESLELHDTASVELPKSSAGYDESIKEKRDSADNKIAVNFAKIEELTQIDGIGVALAQRIVDYRSKNGFFNSADDLLKIKGIGKKKLQTMSNQVTFVKEN